MVAGKGSTSAGQRRGGDSSIGRGEPVAGLKILVVGGGGKNIFWPFECLRGNLGTSISNGKASVTNTYW